MIKLDSADEEEKCFAFVTVANGCLGILRGDPEDKDTPPDIIILDPVEAVGLYTALPSLMVDLLREKNDEDLENSNG